MGQAKVFEKLRRPDNTEQRMEWRMPVGLERVLVKLFIKGSAEVFEDHGSEIMTDCIEGGCKDAKMRGDSADCYRVDTPHSQRLIEIGLEEGTEPSFREEHIGWLRLQIMEHLCPFGPSDSMGFHAATKDEISLKKAVTGKYDGDRNPSASLKEIPYRDNDPFLFPFPV